MKTQKQENADKATVDASAFDNTPATTQTNNPPTPNQQAPVPSQFGQPLAPIQSSDPEVNTMILEYQQAYNILLAKLERIKQIDVMLHLQLHDQLRHNITPTVARWALVQSINGNVMFATDQDVVNAFNESYSPNGIQIRIVEPKSRFKNRDLKLLQCTFNPITNEWRSWVPSLYSLREVLEIVNGA